MSEENPIYDVHHHFGLGPLDDPSEELSVEEKARRHIDAMKAGNVSGAALLPPPVYLNPDGLADTAALNDDVATVRDEYPEWFPVALGTVEPSYGPRALEEIDRVMADLDLDGIMWHSRFQKAPPNAPIMYELVERVADHDGVVHLHAYVESKLNAPWRVFDIIDDFPEVTFVVHDFFSGADQSAHLRQRAPDLPNAHFDTAAASFLTRRVENFVEDVGARHLVFGTDQYTDFPVRRSWEVDAVNYAELSDADRRAIFAENFERIYGLS